MEYLLNLARIIIIPQIILLSMMILFGAGYIILEIRSRRNNAHDNM